MATRYILPKWVLVEVKRGITQSTSRFVFEHEVPILKEVHGDGNIRVIDPPYSAGTSAPPPLPCPIKAEEEYARLEGRYGMHTEVNESNVENVYGKYANGRHFVAECGGEIPEKKALELIAKAEALQRELDAAQRDARLQAQFEARPMGLRGVA